jgi:hypothetical protein
MVYNRCRLSICAFGFMQTSPAEAGPTFDYEVTLTTKAKTRSSLFNTKTPRRNELKTIPFFPNYYALRALCVSASLR